MQSVPQSTPQSAPKSTVQPCSLVWLLDQECQSIVSYFGDVGRHTIDECNLYFKLLTIYHRLVERIAMVESGDHVLVSDGSLSLKQSWTSSNDYLQTVGVSLLNGSYHNCQEIMFEAVQAAKCADTPEARHELLADAKIKSYVMIIQRLCALNYYHRMDAEPTAKNINHALWLYDMMKVIVYTAGLATPSSDAAIRAVNLCQTGDRTGVNIAVNLYTTVHANFQNMLQNERAQAQALARELAHARAEMAAMRMDMEIMSRNIQLLQSPNQCRKRPHEPSQHELNQTRNHPPNQSHNQSHNNARSATMSTPVDAGRFAAGKRARTYQFNAPHTAPVSRRQCNNMYSNNMYSNNM